jgi:hypothetical protein
VNQIDLSHSSCGCRTQLIASLSLSHLVLCSSWLFLSPFLRLRATLADTCHACACACESSSEPRALLLWGGRLSSPGFLSPRVCPRRCSPVSFASLHLFPACLLEVQEVHPSRLKPFMVSFSESAHSQQLILLQSKGLVGQVIVLHCRRSPSCVDESLFVCPALG